MKQPPKSITFCSRVTTFSGCEKELTRACSCRKAVSKIPANFSNCDGAYFQKRFISTAGEWALKKNSATFVCLFFDINQFNQSMEISFFFHLDFLSQPFTNHKTAGEGEGHFFSPSLPLPPASQTLRHQPGDYCKELIDSNQTEKSFSIHGSEEIFPLINDLMISKYISYKIFKEGYSCAVQLYHVTKWGSVRFVQEVVNYVCRIH